MAKDELNTIEQIAARMSCDPRSVERFIAEGRLVAVRVMRRRRMIRESDYQRFIASLEAEESERGRRET